MARQEQPQFFFFDKGFAPARKVIIDGTNVTADLYQGNSFTHEDIATVGIPLFSVTLINMSGTYTDRFRKGQTVEIYRDNDGSGNNASTLRFKGYIEEVSHSVSGGYLVTITGKHLSRDLLFTLVTKTYSNADHATILRDLMTLATGFTSNNVEDTSTSGTYEFTKTRLWDAIMKVCDDGGLDAYVDNDKDLHAFVQGSNQNEDDAAIVGLTMLPNGLGKLGVDFGEEITKVSFVGQDSTGFPVLWTKAAENEDKETLVVDTNISDVESAKTRANLELNNRTPNKNEATARCRMLFNTLPGDSIMVVSFEQGIFKSMRVIKMKHVWAGEVYTDITFEKEPRDLATFLKDLTRRQGGLQKIDNTNAMKYSQNFGFDTDTGTHSNTQIANSQLSLVAGQSSGIWTSPSFALDDTVDEAELRISGSDIGASSVKISLNGGSDYTTLSSRDALEISPAGKSFVCQIIVQSNTNNPEPKIDGVAILMK